MEEKCCFVVCVVCSILLAIDFIERKRLLNEEKEKSCLKLYKANRFDSIRFFGFG